jgi:hypothetical protein
MIDIIGHFFVLYPLLTYIKGSSLVGSLPSKIGASFGLLALASILTNVYLMDASIIDSSGREQNYYEVFEITPREFMSFNKTTLKQQYRQLSRKYHPDKNQDSTPEKFMNIKSAFELLSSPERRQFYDIYGQTDFQYDDQIKMAYDMKFKNATEREFHWNQYLTMRTNMKVFAEVFPYYFTWMLLTLFRVDRERGINMLLVVIGGVAFFEVQARLKYGEQSFESFISNLYTFFPAYFTVGENMQLTRQLFPLIFQFILIVSDYTVDI